MNLKRTIFFAALAAALSSAAAARSTSNSALRTSETRELAALS